MNQLIRQTLQPEHDEPVDTARALVPAVDRAMRILALMESQPQECFTVSDIARNLGIPKSTTFNICGALSEGQLLRRSRDGFKLGRRLVQLGSAYVSSINIVREFYDVSRMAPMDLRATIQMGALDEDFHVVYLAHQDCNSGLRLGLGGGIGRRVPANCSACGKALLANLRPQELDRRLDETPQLPKLTRKSIISRAKLLKAVADARESGYATDDEETLNGLCCVAATLPTSCVDGGFVAVSISAAKDTLTDERADTIRSVLDRIVDELRLRL
jgi:DNA-binding IclR family transcriptional regulator